MNKTDIKKGHQKLLLGLIVVFTLRLALALVMTVMTSEHILFEQWDEVYWLITGMVAVGGAATYHGSIPGRYLLVGILIIAAALEIYYFGPISWTWSTFRWFSFPAWLTMGGLIYLIMIDSQTGTYLSSKRARNYGEYVVTGPPTSEDAQNQSSDSPEYETHKVKASEKTRESFTSWEQELDIYTGENDDL